MTDFFEVDMFRRAAGALDAGLTCAELETLGYGRAEHQPENLRALLDLAQSCAMAFATPAPFASGVHIFCARLEHEGQGLNAAGRGPSRRAAFERCLGEMAELTALHGNIAPASYLTFADFQASLGANQARWAFEMAGLDPESSRVPAIEAEVLVSGERVFVPAELVVRPPEGARMGTRPAPSTGLGAGPDLEAAFESAFYEVIERDALALWWHGNQPARLIDRDDLPAAVLADPLERRPERPWWALDLTSDLGIPVAAVVSGLDNGTAIVVGAAASHTLDHAIERAFLEMCQLEFAQFIALARARKDPSTPPQGKDKEWLERYRALSLSRFPELLPDVADPVARLEGASFEQMIENLAARGFSVLRMDLTRDDLQIPVYRCVIPGLQPKDAAFVSERLDAARQRFTKKGIATEPKPEIL